MEQGEECNLSCTGGAILTGPSSLTCNDGNWAELALGIPKCEFKQCKDQSSIIKGGKIECDKTNGNVNSGSSCQVVCDQGFKPLGNQEVTCRTSGTYSANIGRCQKQPSTSNTTNGGTCPDILSQFNSQASFFKTPSCIRRKVVFLYYQSSLI